MDKIFLSFTILILAASFLPGCGPGAPLPPLPQAPGQAGPTALVYQGEGSCVEGCSEAAAEVARRAGLPVRYVSAAQITPELLAGAVVWIQPGGDAIQAAHAMGPTRLAMISQYVAAGGSYLGFCAGAFLVDGDISEAGDGSTWGMGILPGSTDDYLPGDQDSRMLRIQWQADERWMYFQAGASITFNSPGAGEVLARYPDQRAAAVTFVYGDGKVAISGVHPEAPDWWKKADHLVDPDGADFAYSDELLSRVRDHRPSGAPHGRQDSGK